MPEIRNLTLEEATQRVRDILRWHRGEENKITRWELVEQVYGPGAVEKKDNNNYYDRSVREIISAYRDVDFIVSTTSDGGGYWLAENLAEADQIAGSYDRRAKLMLKKASDVRKRAVEHFGPQVPMF